MRSAKPRRFKPAAAKMMASYSPESNLANRVLTFPRNSTNFKSGRLRSNWHWRRREDVPTRAPWGRSSMHVLVEPLGKTMASQGSWRLQIMPNVSPSGNSMGTSFVECTAISESPSRRARSNSFTKRPLPPILASGESRILSPRVDMGCNSISIPGCKRLSSDSINSACHIASGLLRVAMRIFLPAPEPLPDIAIDHFGASCMDMGSKDWVGCWNQLRTKAKAATAMAPKPKAPAAAAGVTEAGCWVGR
mmetsp:Transcript_118577/g.206515  ORF Transcript_118577/g.206515 Transcript_118577/m.206515 type:complete len:249 (-) Transcript_118577:349-1095(-)